MARKETVRQAGATLRTVADERTIPDPLICILLAAVSSLLITHIASLFPVDIYFGHFDFWYGADQPRVFSNLTDFGHNERSIVHPIFTILLSSITQSLIALGLSDLAATRLIVVTSSASCVVFLYATVRCIGLRQIDAVLVCSALMASASFIFWCGLVETFPVAAATMSGMLLISAHNSNKSLPWIVGSAATLSVTTTNWSLGLLVTYFSHDNRRFLKITFLAFLLVLLIAVIQKILMPSSAFFLSPFDLAKEQEYTYLSAARSDPVRYYTERLLNFWIFTGVNPAPRYYHDFSVPDQPFVKILSSRISNISFIGFVGMVTWILMLAAGAVGMWHRVELKRLSHILTSFLLFQMLLHMVYGDEPFLFSLHFLPAMILVVSFGFLGPAAAVSRFATMVFVVAAATSNQATFREAIYRAYAGLDLSGRFAMVQQPSLYNISSLWPFLADGQARCRVTEVTVVASGTNYEGPPIFKLLMDGVEIGQRTIISAPSSTRQVTNEEIARTLIPYKFEFDSRAYPGQLRVRFVNDHSAGTGMQGDRNLYVESVWIGAQKYAADLLEIYADGDRLDNGNMLVLFSNGSAVLTPRDVCVSPPPADSNLGPG